MNDEDCQTGFNLTLNEPPLKRFKRRLEKISNFASDNESSPLNLPQFSASTLNSDPIKSPQKSTLEKWRESENSLPKFEVSEIEMGDISDSFFSDPMMVNQDENELDFDIEGLSDVDQEIFSEIYNKYGSNDPYHRVKILKIEESFYHIEGQRFQHPQKILECILIKNDSCLIEYAPLKVIVRGDWLQCRFSDEMIINIIGPVVNGEILIDDGSNYLVVSPDILINNTAIAESFACMRKAVIAYRTTVSVEDNKPSASLVIGSVVHELVEEAFRSGFSREINADDLKLNALIKGHIEKIFCCEKDEKHVRDKVLEIMANFPKWHALYLRKVPALHGYVQDPMRSKASNKSNEKSTICITKVLDLEENIWSAMFGLKGKIDATVLSRFKCGNFTSEPVLTPFELKTGQTTTSVSHRAQTLLYTLLLFDRYKRPIDYGLLYYITTGDLIRMPSFRDEIRLILIRRNLLAQEIEKSSESFPDQIRNEHMCKQCNHVDSCVMIHKLAEMGTVSTSSVPKLFEQKTAHLDGNDLHKIFFKKWMNLITLEEEDSVKSRSELWRFDTEWRSNRGKCLNEMKLISCDKIGEADEEGYLCILKKHNSNASLKTSLLNSYINERDPVVISCEDPQTYALATGIVKTIHPDLISIITDRPIKLFQNHNDNDDFNAGNVRFCIDKNELTSTFGTMRGNVIKLFSVECQKLMDLVVNLRAPTFLPRVPFDETILNDFNRFGMREDYSKMDSDQREAFYRALETKDYLLILGMPGTGKSTTLAFIIRYLVLVLGRTILISSHTHSAIDHIALKLQEKNLPFLRIGHEDKIDGKIDKANILDRKTFSTTSEVEHCYANARVVICTSFGMNHEIFMRKRFDYCLVDEASQLTLPACIGSLRVAQSFILVGDHFQLPPLVRSRDALKGGLGESLFKTLAEAHPSAMTSLCNQYRMNDDIMLMANKLTYRDLLKCGSERVRTQTLKLTTIPSHLDTWMQKIFSESCKVGFLNTDNVKDLNVSEVVNGNSFHNEGEAEIIKRIVDLALNLGVKSDQISLISPYRPQLKYLSFNPEITVSTIDKFQGKDSDFVIISLVRSNPFGAVGELLNDWQRLNVAFTRAKKKLILIGSERTVLQNISFKKLKDLIEEQGWMIEM